MNLSAINSNNPYFSSEHINPNLMICTVLQSLGKSLQFTKHLSSLHLKGNTQLQIQKCWVTLRSESYQSLFLSDFPQYLSTISNRYPTDKTLKKKVQFFKQQWFIYHQHQYKISNLNESLNCVICFTMIALGAKIQPDANVQNSSWEISAQSYILFLWLRIIKSIINSRTFP